eukprot:12704380-Alexandrium_andersonii.AAC.1
MAPRRRAMVLRWDTPPPGSSGSLRIPESRSGGVPPGSPGPPSSLLSRALSRVGPHSGSPIIAAH